MATKKLTLVLGQINPIVADIEYNTEKLIETDIKTKAEIVSLQVSKGIMTPDEGAIKMGNNPIDSEFGKLHWTQSQNNPIEYYDQWGKKSNPNESKQNQPEGDNSSQE